MPQRRMASASYTLPPFDVWLTAPLLVVLGAAIFGRRVFRGFIAVALTVAVLGLVLFASRHSVELYQVAWRPAMFMLGFAAIAAMWIIGRLDARSDKRHQQAAAVLFVTAFCGLIQLPFPAPIYFCYVAPLVVLTVAALVSAQRVSNRLVAFALLVFFGLFVALRVTPGYIYAMGNAYANDALDTRLFLHGAHTLKVDRAQAHVYDQLVPMVTQFASGGAVYASPDCPEVYFLTGMPNPTRTIYEFLSEPRATSVDILAMLTARHVTVVVINGAPDFSGAMPDDLHDALRLRFPESTTVGPFEVRWTN